MQKKDLISYCDVILRTDNYVIFEDAGYSGKNMDRPGFQEMIARVRKGEFTHILVWKIDRISRNLLDFASMYTELKQLGVTFVSRNEQFDTSTAMGEAMLKIILVFAELERNMTSERVTATMISRAGNGLWNGGRVPFGYDYDTKTKLFSINEKEAEVVHLLHDGYMELRSLIKLSRYVNDLGHRTRAGSYWTPAGIAAILNSYFYCGDYLYNVHEETKHTKIKDKSEWVYFNDHHPAIVTKEQKDQIIEQLTWNDRGKGMHNKGPRTNKFIFQHKMYCGKCGRMLYAGNKTQADGYKYAMYSCVGRRDGSCDQKSFSEAILGQFIINFVLNLYHAQKDFTKDTTLEDLQKDLLYGLDMVEKIDDTSLHRLYDLLTSKRVSNTIYQPDAIDTPNVKPTISQKHLQTKRDKLEKALQKLTDLYLYSEDMTKNDYVMRKKELVEQINDIDNQLESIKLQSKGADDAEFMQLASEFLITKLFDENRTIKYKELIFEVDHDVFYRFTDQILSRIEVYNAFISKIEFTNGLAFTFEYKNAPKD